jgi:hypothetical protein
VLSWPLDGESGLSWQPGRLSAWRIWLVRITLARATLFAVQMAFFRYVDDMLNLGFECSLQGDERADGAAFWLLVYVVEVPALFQIECEPVQGVEPCCARHGRADPEENGPRVHGCSPGVKCIPTLRYRTGGRVAIAVMRGRFNSITTEIG